MCAARLDERTGQWLVTVEADGRRETSRFDAVISAVGQLNHPSFPDIEGAASFGGPSFHSARWDHDVDLTGQRVGVIGSGASGYQVVPSIVDQVGEMRLFLRNPPWTVPTPNYHAGLAPGLAALFKTVPYYHRWFRFYQFWTSVEGRREFAAVDPGWHGPGAVSAKNQQLRETLTRNLMAEYEGRPDLQRLMIPRYPPYGKRMLRDNGVWACAPKQPNVTVVGEAIERITRAGVVTADGTEHPDLEGDDAQTGPQLGGVVPVDVAVTRDTHRAIRKPLLKLRQAAAGHVGSTGRRALDGLGDVYHAHEPRAAGVIGPRSSLTHCSWLLPFLIGTRSDSDSWCQYRSTITARCPSGSRRSALTRRSRSTT